ncbi:MAG: GT2 family glycosyltransferase [Sphingobacteriales bacterium]|jgi:GT2 family glycosyltransferase
MGEEQSKSVQPTMKLSVIIVNYNVKFFLEQTLRSVRKAVRNIDAEVWVVDNNSVDGSLAMLEDKFPEVKLIANKDNTGFSKANNQAIRESKGEYVLLLNPDTVVQEDTFEKCIQFMDSHEDAGALGVKMLDGKGKFLPESKRGLPTPSVAFYKIFGLSKLFPKSKTFGQYHLKYLPMNEVNVVDVLSGAFMFMRKACLDKCGLLDEQFFMYGEDIDLSYRITKSGYKNYYFPETQIIHYKGESTKKSSVNYVFVFYRAMAIFAKKHFSAKRANSFALLINLAIYLRATWAVLGRVLNRLAFPILDSVMLYGGLYFLKLYWENNHKYVSEPYSIEFLTIAAPSYILLWLTGIFLAGGYDRPLKMSRIWRGLILGTLAIIIMYAFISLDYRFSRALVLLGSFWAFIAVTLSRMVYNFIKSGTFNVDSTTTHRVVIVGSKYEGSRVLNLMQQVNNKMNFIGFIYPYTSEDHDKEEFVGNVSQLNDICTVYNINEIIFCNKDIPSTDIISIMSNLEIKDMEYKIVPDEGSFIIGSNSTDAAGSLYSIEIKLSITDVVYKRAKRILDSVICLYLLVTLPLNLFIIKKPFGLLSNWFAVFFGKKSWVGFDLNNDLQDNLLPTIKSGVLNPSDALEEVSLNPQTRARLNMLYARHYKPENDLIIIYKGYRQLGRR